MKKRVLSLFLALTLCLTLTPTGALAEESLPGQTVVATQETETPTPAPQKEESTAPAENGADENASPASPDEKPTENTPAAPEKNPADEEPGKEAGQNEPTAEGKNEPLALGLDDAEQNAADGENDEAGMSNVLEFTVAEKADPVASVTMSDGTERSYDSFSDAWAAAIANNGSTLKLLADGTLSDDNTDIGNTLTLDLNGYMLGSSGSLTVKNGAALTVKNASAENSGNPVQVGLYLTLLVEKGGSFTCTDGKIQYLGLQAAGTGDYAIQLTEGESHCTFGGFAQGDANATVGDLLKATPGMALYAEDTGSTVQIARSTLISNGFNYFSFYVGACSEHQIGEDGTCDYCGASYVASVTTGGKTVSYTSLDDALDAVKDGDTVTLLSDVDLGETYVTIDKSITFDLGDKTLSSSKAWLSYGVLLIKNATVTVKNGTVKATGSASCAIRAYGSGASMTLEDVTATVTSDESSVMVGDFGSTVIKSGDYQGLYVGAKSQVTLEGGTFRPYMDTITTNENVKSIFWQVNETTDTTSRDCMELLGDGCVYVDETETQVRTGGGFNTVVTVQQGTAIDAPVAKIGDVEYASLSKAINAVQNGGTITLLNDLDLGNGAVLQVGSPRKNFTIDLASHTLSADGDCLIMLHNGSQLTLKNGTLDGSRCTSYEGVLYISSNSGPKLTLENVTAKNVQRSVPLVYVTNGTVEFDGGTYTGGVLVHSNGNAVLKNGTFQKGNNSYSIKTDVSGKQLSNYLDGESLFWKDNAPLDLSSATETADEVIVRPCEHKWENGKCTVCQKVCDHGSADGKSMTGDPCPTCGMKAAAQVDITGSDAKYFLTFSDALYYATRNNGCTLKLLANVTDPVSINTPFIFDLNGHDVNKLSVGARVKIRDSSTIKGTIKELKVFNIVDTDTVLTVADLLEEGYAFKSSSGNTWYFGVENAITNVTVQPAPIKSVTAEHPTVTVEYGKTSGVTLTATAVPATEGGTVSYQWYKIGGTVFPIQDATENTYPLPADLGAGTHTYRLTATSDGYPKSVDITVKVTPISLEGAEVTVKDLTYNGQKQFPTVTVKLDENTTLTKGTDFDVDATMQANAGSYTLTVKGNGNYSGEIKDVEWKIEPMKIDSVMVSSGISKTYDGTATVTKTAEEWAEILTFKTLSAYPVVDVPSGAYTISDAYFVEKSGEETIHSPDAGEKYGITFKITLNDDNYVLQTYGEDTPSTSKEITQSGGANFTIEQAGAPNMSAIRLEQYVFNGLSKTYEIDLKTLLPELTKPCEYGDITYGTPSVTLNDAYYDMETGAKIENGKLLLPIKATGTVKGEIGTVTVDVTTTNYKPFKLTLNTIAQDKIPLDKSGVTVSASDITYGQKLEDSTLTVTGSMKCPRMKTEIPGTFAWTDDTVKPNAGDYEAEWTFTPAEGYEEYAPATGNVTVKVKPAKLTVSVKASRMYYTGEEQIASIIASGESVDSTPVTFTYSTTENGIYTSEVPAFTDAGTYTVYYKAEAANHEPATGTFTVTIDPLPISLLSVSSISKTYDGSADVTLTADKLTFFSKTASRQDITLPNTALTFSDAQFTSKQEDGSYLPSPEVGNGKALSFTMTLTSNNYVFEGESGGTVSDVFATDDANRFTITKAAAPTMQPIELTVINGLAKTYLVNLPALPTLGDNCKYGSIKYEACNFDLIGEGGYANSMAMITSNDEFQLAVPAVESQTEGSVGTVGVKITTDNYQDMLLTVEVIAKNKIVPVPDGDITATPITFGQILRVSTIAGTMKDDGNTVEGTFEWTDPSTKPDKAGDYQAEWTFTPAKGYEEYATATGTVNVKVNPAKLTAVSVKASSMYYTGEEQIASIIASGQCVDSTPVTFTYSTTENGIYTSEVPAFTDAGTYTVYYKAEAANHEPATGTFTVTIDPLPISLLSVSSISKTYDGSADVTLTADKLTFFSKTASRQDITLPNTALTFSDAQFTSKQEDGSYLPSPEVGNGKALSFTMTLASDNYVFEGKSEGTKTISDTFATDDTTRFTITKAAAPTNIPSGTLNIINGTQQTYTYDFSKLLPELSKGQYGTISYGNQPAISLVSQSGYYYDQTIVEFKNGQLILANFSAKDGTMIGQIGTVNVTVTTTNYEDFQLTLVLNAINKPTPDDKITASNITYGQALSASTITGKMKDPNTGKEITGTFTWTDGTVKPNAGNHNAEWIFTPDGSYGGKYTTYTDTAPVTVNPKAVTVNITPNGGTYGSVTAAAAKLSGAVEGDNVPVTLTYTGNGYNSTAVPTNAGSYTVTASIADSNYVLTGETTANFVIEPKSIKGAKVVLGKALTANGAEQTQTVEKVLLDGKELPADSYTVTDNTATAPGRHTLTVTGKGNYKDSVKWTYVIAPAKAEDAPGEDIAIGSGKVKVDVQSEGTVPPATLLTDKAELLAMLVDSGDITADELVQIANGASADIVLTVKEANVSDEVKTAMAQAAKGYTIGQYLDISLFKYMTVNGKQQDGVALHTTKNALTISVAVPDALINTNSALNRTYCIVRNHEGPITVLDAAFDAASKTLTFKTDRFSDYAIAYKDTAVPGSTANPGSGNRSNDSETKKNEVAAPTPAPTPASTSKPSTITAMPQTGDTSNPTLYVVLLVASLLGLAVVFVCKKRNDK